MVFGKLFIVIVELAAYVPCRVTPSEHCVAFSLDPFLMIGHYAREAWRMEEGLGRESYVDEGRALGGAESVSKNVSNDPGMLAREVVEGEALFLFCEFS